MYKLILEHIREIWLYMHQMTSWLVKLGAHATVRRKRCQNVHCLMLVGSVTTGLWTAHMHQPLTRSHTSITKLCLNSYTVQCCEALPTQNNSVLYYSCTCGVWNVTLGDSNWTSYVLSSFPRTYFQEEAPGSVKLPQQLPPVFPLLATLQEPGHALYSNTQTVLVMCV